MQSDLILSEQESVDTLSTLELPMGAEEYARNAASGVEDDEIGEDGADELFEHFAITVDKGQKLLRLDKYLVDRMEHCSRNRIQTAADNGNILVNGVAAKSSYKVKPLDRITLVMPYPKREIEIIPEDIPLEIVYEDDDIIIVNKQAGMVVHPGCGNYSGTLVNALTYHLRDFEAKIKRGKNGF